MLFPLFTLNPINVEQVVVGNINTDIDVKWINRTDWDIIMTPGWCLRTWQENQTQILKLIYWQHWLKDTNEKSLLLTWFQYTGIAMGLSTVADY